MKKTQVILFATFLLFTLTAFQAQAAPTVTTGGLLQFTSKSEFNTAFPGQPVEDFQESSVAAGVADFCPAPMDSATTGCAGFTAGDILDGLSIDGPPNPQLVLVGSSFGGWSPPSISLSTFNATDTHQIDFSGTVNAVGFDLTGQVAMNTTINIYGASGLLDSLTVAVTTVTQTFTGIYSDVPITQITITAASIRVIDNIQFGTVTSDLSFYTSQATFEAAHPGLPVEDFEESPIADGGFLFLPEPLDSSTNVPGSFVTGDILPGLAIGTVSLPGGSPIGIVGANGVYGNQSVMIAQQLVGYNLTLSFTNNDTYAVGMDLMYSATNDASIIVYGPNNSILGMTSVTIPTTETFFGVYANQPITKIAVINGSDFEFVDNIQFGGSPMDLAFYNSRASFPKPGQPIEDFEESPVAAAGVIACSNTINSATNDACFSAGDIIDGITFQTTVGGTMVVLGAGFGGAATSKVIGPSNFAENLEILFANKNVDYFGTDIVLLGGTIPADMLFSFYDTSDSLIGSAYRNVGTTPVFLGVISSAKISRITVTNPGSPGELVDNVVFGTTFPWPMFLPAITNNAP